MYSLRKRQVPDHTIVNIVATVSVSLVTIASLWIALFVTGAVTLGGVPYEVLMKFWQDPEAREAYFSGNGQVLHDRLGDLGIEYEIKRYYRSRIRDPIKLDQHIHQILYDRTGYVGAAYTVNAKGTLILRDIGEAVEIENCPNC
jgi:hypothetical protein